jgi:serine/threonine protein kinase
MTDRTGQQLGNYLLTRPLGQGGFAEVYLGQHIYLKTQAAIKVLLTQLSGDDMEEFLNEARTIANLIHPNIVRVLEFGVEGKTPFLVMDYAPNGTLRQRHPKGSRLEPAVIVPYIKQIAGGLQYAHDQKLIHRDIKPENLLVGRHNEILLSDFGIALVAQSSRYQSTQDVVGTVAYMSPEQIQGKPRPASDLYSLGIVVYEWLTGDRPFHGSFTELCTQHMFASPPPLRERVPSIPSEIEQVVNTALAKDPKQRFGSVQAFANALEQASQNQVPTMLKTPSSQPLSSSSLPPTKAVIAPPPLSTEAAIPPPPPPPPFAPQQLANRASMPYGYGSPYNYNARPAPPTTNGKVNVWRMGKRQLLATMISTVLFTLAYFGVDKLYTLNPNPTTGLSPLFSPIFPSFNNTFSFTFTFGGMLFFLAFTIPLFVAVEFGPWAGAISVVVGNLLGDYLAFHQLISPWYYYIGNPLLVFIPGFVLAIIYSTSGRKIEIPIVLALTVAGIVVSNLFVVIGDSIAFHYAVGDLFGEYTALSLEGVIFLLALLIMLIISNAITKTRRSI